MYNIARSRRFLILSGRMQKFLIALRGFVMYRRHGNHRNPTVDKLYMLHTKQATKHADELRQRECIKAMDGHHFGVYLIPCCA